MNNLDSRFNISVGGEYTVYAMDLTVWGIQVLILTDGGRPSWTPIEMFHVTHNALPSDWKFERIADEAIVNVIAIWGYRSMLDKPDHFDTLIDRKPSALIDFLADCDRSDLTPADIKKLTALEQVAST